VYGTGEAGRIVGLSHGGQVERVIVSAEGGLENRGSNAATTPSLEERGDARVVRMKRSACSGSEIDGPYDLMRLRGAWTARHLALVFCDLICPRERERPFYALARITSILYKKKKKENLIVLKIENEKWNSPQKKLKKVFSFFFRKFQALHSVSVGTQPTPSMIFTPPALQPPPKNRKKASDGQVPGFSGAVLPLPQKKSSVW
jgi:hypothetical protein